MRAAHALTAPAAAVAASSSSPSPSLISHLCLSSQDSLLLCLTLAATAAVLLASLLTDSPAHPLTRSAAHPEIRCVSQNSCWRIFPLFIFSLSPSLPAATMSWSIVLSWILVLVVSSNLTHAYPDGECVEQRRERERAGGRDVYITLEASVCIHIVIPCALTAQHSTAHHYDGSSSSSNSASSFPMYLCAFVFCILGNNHVP